MKWQRDGKIAHILRIRAQKQVFQSTIELAEKVLTCLMQFWGDLHIELSNFHPIDEPHLFIQYFSNPPSLKFFCSMTSEHVERGTFY